MDRKNVVKVKTGIELKVLIPTKFDIRNVFTRNWILGMHTLKLKLS